MSSVTAAFDPSPLVALLRDRPRGVTVDRIRDEAIGRGSTLAAFDALTGGGESLFSADPDSASQPPQVRAASEAIRGWADQGIRTLSVLDPAYPQRLRQVPQGPPVLFVRGRYDGPETAVSVVGSREAPDAALAFAADVAAGLVALGITVVSGLAHGIDTAAHTTTLDAGGRTVAFVAHGVDIVYPAANRGLRDRLLGAGGAVFSQYLPGASARKHTFLARNSLMSGYGMASVIVEAGEHSGARSQATHAVRHGRPVVLTTAVMRNEWARQIVGHEQVRVASTVAEVLGHVQDITATAGRGT